MIATPLLAVLEETGWNVCERPTRDGRSICYAHRSKYHLVGEGLTPDDAQGDVLEMIVDLEWEDFLEARDQGAWDSKGS